MSSYVNVQTGKIVGAKPHTMKWYHEKGHIEYNNSALGIRNAYRQWFYGFIALTAIILGQVDITFTIASFVFLIMSWYYFIYEEFYCWRYASRKMKGGIRIDGRMEETSNTRR